MQADSVADQLRRVARARRESEPQAEIDSLVERVQRECRDAAERYGAIRCVITVKMEDEPMFVNPLTPSGPGMTLGYMRNADEWYVRDKRDKWREDAVSRVRAAMPGCDVDSREWPYILVTWGY